MASYTSLSGVTVTVESVPTAAVTESGGTAPPTEEPETTTVSDETPPDSALPMAGVSCSDLQNLMSETEDNYPFKVQKYRRAPTKGQKMAKNTSLLRFQVSFVMIILGLLAIVSPRPSNSGLLLALAAGM